MFQLAVVFGILGAVCAAAATIVFVTSVVIGPTIAQSWHRSTTSPRLWSRRLLFVSLALLSASDLVILTNL